MTVSFPPDGQVRALRHIHRLKLAHRPLPAADAADAVACAVSGDADADGGAEAAARSGGGGGHPLQGVPLGDEEAECVFSDLAAQLGLGDSADADGTMLRQRALAALPEADGGLLPIAGALLHPSASVRHHAVLALRGLRSEPQYGEPAFAALNPFLRCAYDALCAKLMLNPG